jgi:hypothetical protein
VYNADTGEIISVTYLNTTCEGNDCDDTGGGGGGGSDDPPASGVIYICVSSFNFQPQGTGSITNISKTWGIIGSYVIGQSTYTTTFGIETYAPTDVINWGNAWSELNLNFYYLIQSGDIWLRTDIQGVLHLMYSARAQKEIAAAAIDYASDNNRNPKSVLAEPTGSSIYKQRFKDLFTNFMKNYIPGTTAQVLNSFVSGCAQATYSNTPC